MCTGTKNFDNHLVIKKRSTSFPLLFFTRSYLWTILKPDFIIVGFTLFSDVSDLVVISFSILQIDFHFIDG